MNRLVVLTAFLIVILLPACKKNSSTAEIDPNRKGSVMLYFDNRAGTQELILNSPTYQNALGQDLAVSKFNYYISNIKLLNKDGSTYSYPKEDSYFLIQETDVATQSIKLSNVPEGDYSGVVFTLGVDSLKSVSKIAERIGVLDPSAGGADMYWGWNSGYIFLKMEGSSSFAPLDSTTMQRPVEYHIGLFGLNGATNNLKTITIPFNGVYASVRQAKTNAPEAHFFVDVLKVVNGSSNIDFSVEPSILSDKNSVNVANNYKEMFALDHVHNE
jgi:hypothetical protein